MKPIILFKNKKCDSQSKFKNSSHFGILGIENILLYFQCHYSFKKKRDFFPKFLLVIS